MTRQNSFRGEEIMRHALQNHGTVEEKVASGEEGVCTKEKPCTFHSTEAASTRKEKVVADTILQKAQ